MRNFICGARSVVVESVERETVLRTKNLENSDLFDNFLMCLGWPSKARELDGIVDKLTPGAAFVS